MRRTMTARQRLAVFANVSRMQSDQETYDMAVNRDVELKRQCARAESAEAERDALRALLREARDDWIKVGYGASHEDVAACRDFCDRIDAALGERDE